jgi:RNA polymerase sigma factor (sigma-70 family)
MNGDLPSHFPTTRFSAIKGLRDDDADRRRVSWDALISVYWRPSYMYARIRWRLESDQAQDLVQSFFLTAFEKQYLTDFDPTAARFRTYLRTCLDRFIMKEQRAVERIKRGGQAEHLSLDFASADSELHRQAASAKDRPDQLFDKEWVRSILVLSIHKFKAVCDEHQREIQFKLFEIYDLGDDETLSYAQLGERYGLSEATVTNYLAWARRQFRQTVLETIAELTANEEEYREEVLAILGIKLA